MRMKDRNNNGQFASGNAGGPGNPFGRRVAKLRGLLMDSVSDDDLKEIVASMVQQAKAGDAAAVKLLLAYLVGKPGDAVDPDRLAVDEARNEADLWQAKDRTRMNKPGVDLDLTMFG